MHVDVGTPDRVHGLVACSSDDELLSVVLGWARAGLADGDLTVVVVLPWAAEHVRAELPGAEVCELGPPAPRAPDGIALQLGLVRRAAAEGRRLRMVGQVHEDGGDPRLWDERLRCEVAYEHVFGATPLSTLCVYDRRTVPPAVLEAALLAHPQCMVDRHLGTNPAHLAPLDVVASLGTPVEPLQAAEPVFAVDDAPTLPELRHALSAALRGRFADRDTEEDVHLAASEIAANAFRHGGRPVSARVWADAERVVLTVSDGGQQGFDGRLAGYRPAHGDDLAHGGMGLWLARKLCDHVDVESGATGTTVRLTTAVRPRA
ncbi:ATP-binding protein [Klenkia brasiliensis]|uniref:Anti-sigma regulatory factor (Ser/Thr protein kinase) n=1 Tax=Klenkia brasiliensis TaxID=333142 RepID=A0A1G7Y0G8_9ACTN|nr:ATP-binding protein [Klenkia brasiliensis]SDG89891.1 Anti-sigma regulatory factor (Ser/Thr protein kinase) [Klenkia brasiliensis]